jgi:lysophospholipase L1-like esterase
MRKAVFEAVFGLAVLSGLVALSAQAAVPAGARYVAMGSSYAAGPGVTTLADSPVNRCFRSRDNYAHQVAARLKLDLVDVSCSGATTKNVLADWNEIPAQVSAVTADTKLVTLTIGGNDLNYVGNLGAASCAAIHGPNCPAVRAPTEADFTNLGQAFHAIIAEIRQRAPQARIVFVEYPAVLPPSGLCAATPMTADEGDMLRATAARLVAITDQVADAEKVEVLPFATYSKDHGACGADPWMAGYVDASGQRVRVPYHPNLAGMTAVADDLTAVLGK